MHEYYGRHFYFFFQSFQIQTQIQPENENAFIAQHIYDAI